jgi:hypothetical protein
MSMNVYEVIRQSVPGWAQVTRTGHVIPSVLAIFRPFFIIVPLERQPQERIRLQTTIFFMSIYGFNEPITNELEIIHDSRNAAECW